MDGGLGFGSFAVGRTLSSQGAFFCSQLLNENRMEVDGGKERGRFRTEGRSMIHDDSTLFPIFRVRATRDPV